VAPVIEPSSQDLHPSTGARFVFDRQDDSADGPVYQVLVHLPEGRRWAATLRWLDGRAELEPSAEADARAPAPQPAELDWVRAEALKLARVLHRDPRQHMLRWRGRP
jgi:hypothetical protein